MADGSQAPPVTPAITALIATLKTEERTNQQLFMIAPSLATNEHLPTVIY